MPDHDLDLKGHKNYHVPKAYDFKIAETNIGVDSVGVGAATVDGFLEKAYNVISLQGGQLDAAIPVDDQGKPMYAFSALRSQMYWQLRIDLERSKVIINIASAPNYKNVLRDLLKEVVQIKYSIKGGKIAVESKEEIKKRLGGKSPDLLDALVYWNWMRHNFYEDRPIGLFV